MVGVPVRAYARAHGAHRPLATTSFVFVRSVEKPIWLVSRNTAQTTPTVLVVIGVTSKCAKYAIRWGVVD